VSLKTENAIRPHGKAGADAFNVVLFIDLLVYKSAFVIIGEQELN
jgi:hypothetical protein